jgi:transposase InsO family protein
MCLEPFEIIHVDYTGPYTAASAAWKLFCLFIIDAFTGWLEVYPTTAATGNATITSLGGYCKRFGFLQILHSDRGPHFYNRDCLAWAQKMGLKRVFGSPGQAKGLGKVERAIRSVKTSIRRLADEKPTAWVTLIPDTQLTFNTRHPYSDNGHSPSTLLLGFTPRNKILNLVEASLANKLQLLTDVDGHKEVIKQLQEVRLAKLDAIREEAITMQIDQWARRIAAHE